MTITVITGNWARQYVGQESITLLLPEGAVASLVPDRLGIPHDEAGIVAVNGKAVKPEYRLSDGDIVRIFPAVIAG